MGSGIDDAKGRMKEAAGDITEDKDLKREGKMDQAGAEAKERVEMAKDEFGEAIDKMKDKFDR